MIEQFYSTSAIAVGIIKLLIIISVGYVLNVTGLLKKEGVDGVSKTLMWACLPALIISRMTLSFDPAGFPGWWRLPLFAMGMSLLGLGLGRLFTLPFKKFTSKREFMCSCAYANCGYLPMALTAFVCSGDFCDRLLIYIFLFIVGFNVALWSFAPGFLSGGSAKKFKISQLLNAPLVATVFSLSSVMIVGKGWIPDVIFEPIRLLGDTTFPLALITLGGYLSLHRGHRPRSLPALGTCLLVKLIVMPIIVLAGVKLSSLEASYEFLIFIEAAMPSAVTLVIVGDYAQADNRFLSGVIFYSHLLSVITIPFWLLVFRKVM